MESLQIQINEVAHECTHPITRIPYQLSETELRQEELLNKLKQLDLSVEEIDTWHRMTNPLKEFARHGLHSYTDRLDGLESSTAILLANVQMPQVTNTTEDVRSYLIGNGTLERNSKSTLDIQNKEVFLETDVLGLIHDNLTVLESSVIRREKLDLLFKAGELILDASLIPISRPNLRTPNAIHNFIEGNPSDSIAISRLAAYRILRRVFEEIDSLSAVTPEEYMLKIQSIQHLISMQINDVATFEHGLRTNLPERAKAIDDPFIIRDKETLNDEMLLAGSRIANTGFPPVDRMVSEPWLISALKKESLLKAIFVTEQIFGDKTQAMSHLSKSTYKGMAHEAVWLLDAIVLNSIYGDGNYMFMKSLTRQDKNLEVSKPDIKKSFDIMVRSRNEAPKLFQLKSSAAGLERSGSYDNQITVVHEENFFDHGAARLRNKYNAYRQILESKTSPQETAKLLGKYVLPSVQKNILPLIRT